MAAESIELLRGTLDLLVLKALSRESTHGYGVARWIERATGEELLVEEGSLYPALRRLEDRGLISSEWGTSDNNRRARYYELTAAGRRALKHETAIWTRFARAMFQALEAPAVAEGAAS